MATGKYFSNDELKCKCCGKNLMKQATLNKLDKLRSRVGPLILSSAYRCPGYNNEIGATQTHATGQAVDILCHSLLAFEILRHAADVGFWGIGISQTGNHHTRFIHLDDLDQGSNILRPTIWSY